MIACVMLTTPERAGFAQMAFEAFASQTSKAALSTTHNAGRDPLCRIMNDGMTNALRDIPGATHFAKWDDDDWSSPERLDEQAALMRRTGAWVVGYNEMPFYDVATDDVLLYSNPNPNYVLGTSLFMRREAWEEHSFPDTSTRPGNPRGSGSDTLFVAYWAARGRVRGVSAIVDGEPRMIARIHDTNTSIHRGRGGFRPAPEPLGQRVREIMGSEMEKR